MDDLFGLGIIVVDNYGTYRTEFRKRGWKVKGVRELETASFVFLFSVCG